MNFSDQNVDADFMGKLISELSIAMGPLGSIVVEEGLDLLGFTAQPLPVIRAAELVDLLSQEIPRQENQLKFKQAMLQVIRDKGYL